MKINYNMSAYVANAKLLRNENSLTDSLEKLSSGYRINHAADDPAGMAMSAKMKTQLRGLEQASRNSSDGISVVETAEGALNEVTAIIQRMRELAVQAGNDTYAQEDKQAMQDEIEVLKEEITRISTDTEFNKKTLLDGSLCGRIYPSSSDVSLVQISDTVATGDYKISVTQNAARAELVGTVPTGGKLEGTMSINGVNVHFNGTETDAEAYEKLRSACEIGEVNIYALDSTTPTTAAERISDPESEGYATVSVPYEYGKAIAFVSRDAGSKETITIACDNQELADYFGIPVTQNGDSFSVKTNGADASVSLGTPFSKQATAICDGNYVRITDRNGFEMSFDVNEYTFAKAQEAGTTDTNIDPAGGAEITLTVTKIGDLTLQVGANEYQTISVDIPDMSSKALRISKVDVTTVNGCDKSLIALDAALARVSAVRSSLGACENRLDYAVENLNESDENLTSALSRIEDVDMATEMSTYTQYNVLVQAATSVLAQANDLPEQTLQLLQ